MADPLDSKHEVEQALELAAREAARYVAGLDADPVQPQGSDAALPPARSSLPEEGDGSLRPIAELARLGHATATRSSGPRFFHFVVGGTTPAALGADWLASTLDQNVVAWPSSPLGARLEQVTLDWLRQLFDLPPEFDGVLTTGGTMANFVGLAAGRDWCAGRQGVSAAEQGLAAMPQIPVFSSGHIHASALKALSLLGVGRGNVRKLAADGTGRLDLAALGSALRALGGAPSIVVANAGEVNSGAFDPIDDMAELAERHGAWLHVDGAFGLFARLAPRSADLAAGAERAHSVAADGHKWLNVPYDCGFALVRRADWSIDSYAGQAAYLPEGDDARPGFGFRGPESSRRARALAVWATLRAYGRSGYRAMVERHLDLAQRLAARVDAEPELERLAEVPLNIVCFRWKPEGAEAEELDELNRRLGEELLHDGRVFAGTTVYDGKVAFRPALSNWRTREEDVDLLVDVLLELARSMRPATAPPSAPRAAP